MAILSQNSNSNETILNADVFDGTGFSETLNTYIDFVGLASIPTYNGGAGWNEYAIYGFGGSDKIIASHGDDNIYGGSGDDTIQSFYGYNYIEGGTGRDTLDYSWYGQRTSLDNDLGVNADLAAGHTQEREVISGMRFDDEFIQIESLRGSSFNDRLYGNSSGNTISGGFGNDVISGRSGNDSLLGNENNDSIWGDNGDDKLNGGSGNDVLTGGIGADELTGGAGADRFVFATEADSTIQLDEQDLITDFKSALGDKIDLRALRSSNYDFINFSEFSADGLLFPEIRYEHSGGATVVQVDTNGDGDANIEITLSGILTMHDFNFLS